MAPPDAEVVLVEDSESDRELLLLLLRRSGFVGPAAVLRDGAEALDYFSQRCGVPALEADALPKLVLLDLKLPRATGLEVLRNLKADPRTRRVPVVVVSSSRERRDLTESYDLGANGYVVKPVVFEELTDLVRNLVHYWLRQNRTAEQPRAELPS